jgi:hypothetical protein
MIPTGEYSILELAQLFNVSKKTAGRYVEKFSMEKTQIERFNKRVLGVLLTQENIDAILRQGEMARQGSDHVADMLATMATPGINPSNDEVASLRAQVETLREELMLAKIEIARLEGKIEKLPELERIIAAQDKTIHSQEIAQEALQNERLAITAQLVKYRDGNGSQGAADGSSGPWWQFWK